MDWLTIAFHRQMLIFSHRVYVYGSFSLLTPSALHFRPPLNVLTSPLSSITASWSFCDGHAVRTVRAFSGLTERRERFNSFDKSRCVKMSDRKNEEGEMFLDGKVEGLWHIERIDNASESRCSAKKNAFLSPLNFDFGVVRIQKITGRAKGKRISRVLDWTSIDNWSDAFLTQHENAKHWNKQHAVVQFERVITNLFGAVLRLLFPRKEAKETKRRQIRSIDEKQLLKDNDAIVKMYKSWQAEIKKNWRRRGFLKKSFFFPFKFVFLLFLCFDHSRVR